MTTSGTGTIIEDQPGEHAHETPDERQYVIVAAILAVVTAGEVGLYYIELDKLPMVLALCALAAVKFAMVALWFMHLKFDSSTFRRLFGAGIVIALIVYTIVLLTFGVFLNDRAGPQRAGRAPVEAEE
jgi:cytochrome c oxidase subunit 4